jgi:ParB-like chromosome segregation protein Spo0J
MEIVNIKIEDIKPYENNPRFNDDAVKYVANSIKEFGFKVPMILDKNNTIVAGHTRYKAALELGLKEVPCIIANDLNEEQIKAFRLADNKVSEQASWNYDLLDEELNDILNFDMSDFNFIEHTINWDDIEEINADNYEKPESERLRCPLCGGIDEKIRFVKVSNISTENGK